MGGKKRMISLGACHAKNEKQYPAQGGGDVKGKANMRGDPFNRREPAIYDECHTRKKEPRLLRGEKV